MLDEKRFLTMSAVLKWLKSEPLSQKDVERIIDLIENCELKIDTIENDLKYGLETRLKSVVTEKW